MSKRERGILGLKKDPKNKILFHLVLGQTMICGHQMIPTPITSLCEIQAEKFQSGVKG